MISECFSFEGIPHSTFWVVIVVLVMGLLFNFDLAIQNKKEIETLKNLRKSEDITNRLNYLRNDVTTLLYPTPSSPYIRLLKKTIQNSESNESKPKESKPKESKPIESKSGSESE